MTHSDDLTTDAAPQGANLDSSLDSKIAALDLRSRLLSLLRLGFFGAFIGGFLVLGSLGWTVALPCVLAFAVLFYVHGKVDASRAALEDLQLLQREAQDRRENRRFDRPVPVIPDDPLPLEKGRRVYADEPDVFCLDDGVLDDLQLIEGRHTLFGFLDVSSTIFGARRLHRMLTSPMTSVAAIRDRQGAVSELAENPDTRRKLMETLIRLRRYDFESVPRVLRAPTTFAGRLGLVFGANLLGTAPAVLVVLSFFWPPATAFLLLLLVFNFMIVGMQSTMSNLARERILRPGPALQGIARVGEVLTAAAFTRDAWREIIEVFSQARPATRSLGRYEALLQFHSFGIVFEFFNVFMLWELRILPFADAALLKYRETVERALGALGETEALLSLSAPLLEQDGYVLPEALERDGPVVRGEELGHPLLPSGSVVRNRIDLDHERNVAIITGSNMAGKSTYLKSVAMNTVLAGAGGPVCARSFAWTPVSLYSDINIRDSLDDGKSYFRVEVERILEAIHAATRGSATLTIFDELFRGTNSIERLAISRAILRHLRSTGALVLVATHDVSLTDLVTLEGEGGMRNFHFRELVEDGVMTFDYQLREGPAQTRNAIRVLEAIGYPETITREARAETENQTAE
jgi:hypothetical protein